jgi:hypothetical protein
MNAGNELAKMPAALNWQGWKPDSGVSPVDFFETEQPDRRCVITCERCGFHYLNNHGEPLKKTDTPLCGVW